MGQKWGHGRNQQTPENKWKWTHNSKPMVHSESSPEREDHSISSLSKEDRSISNKQLNIPPERTRKTINPDWFFKKTNKIDKPLTRLKRKKERAVSAKIEA